MRRVLLFIVTNIAVLLVLSIVLRLFGVESLLAENDADNVCRRERDGRVGERGDDGDGAAQRVGDAVADGGHAAETHPREAQVGVEGRAVDKSRTEIGAGEDCRKGGKGGGAARKEEEARLEERAQRAQLEEDLDVSASILLREPLAEQATQ